jgi:hypothetical protein
VGLVQISGTRSLETVGLIVNASIVGLMRNQYPFRSSCRTDLDLYLLEPQVEPIEQFLATRSDDLDSEN